MTKVKSLETDLKLIYMFCNKQELWRRRPIDQWNLEVELNKKKSVSLNDSLPQSHKYILYSHVSFVHGA